MLLNVKLNKNFTTQFNKLLGEYGEEFAQLNGLAEEQLSFSEFINLTINNSTLR